MNKRYLGDAYDFWKGGILRILFNGKTFKKTDLKVKPMITGKDWKDEDYHIYADFLNISKKNIIKAEEIKIEESFIFLDPDTGAETPGGDCGPKRLKINQIKDYLTKKNTLILYQHRRRLEGGIDGTCKEVKKQIQKEVKNINVSYVRTNSAAILFISQNKKHINRLVSALRKVFPKPKDRKDSRVQNI